MSSFANLHPKYIFGLSEACKYKNVWFVDNNVIMYPAGGAIVMLNLDQKTQTFLHGVEKQKGISCMTVSYNRLYAALGHTSGDEGTIAIFDLKTNKRRKTLQSPDVKVSEYASLNFTTDNVHLASLTASPDFTCILWKWERSRVVAMTKTTAGAGPIYEVSTSPMDFNQMCAVGNGCLKFYRLTENHLKPFGYQRGDLDNFISHAWYKSDKVIAGTTDGKLMLFERGEYRHDIVIKNVKNEISGNLAERARLHEKEQSLHGMKMEEEDVIPSSSKDDGNRKRTKFLGEEITAIASYSKGFAASYGVGNVVIFEEQLAYTSSEDHYRQMYVVKIPRSTSESEDRIIVALVVSPNEETIVATTTNCNVYAFQLSSLEIKEEDEMVFEFANCAYHYGAIVGLDVAIRKSLIVTCGVDKFIRIWNFLSMTQEAQAEFAEEIYSVAIHPTGLFILAGMVDKIRMYSVLLNDIREFKDWSVRSCKELRFSNGGHLFAAANGNIMHVYSTTTLESTASMKGHSNKIRRITWSLDDGKVTTAGADGAIYEWDVHTGKRTADLVERGSKLVSVVSTPDAKTYFAVNNGAIKEIQIQDGVILKELELGAVPTCLSMSRSGKVLLAGFENGFVRSFRQPLTVANEWNDYYLHLGSVNALVCTFDEIYCISVGSDNSIILWKMTDSEGRVAKLEKELNYASEVLITKSDLDVRQVAINDLKQKYAELKIEMDYSLKRKDMTYQEEIRDLNLKFIDDIEKLKENIEALEKLNDKNSDSYNAYLLEVKKQHKSSLDNMEAHFNTKLISEFEKYNALQNLLEETIKEYENRLITLETDRGKAIEDLVEYFDTKIKDKNTALDQTFACAKMQMSESEEMKKQIEEDADQEILELTSNYERKLRHEREVNSKLKGEAGIMSKKFQTMQKEIEERMNEVQRLHIDASKLSNTIKATEREVVKLQKELVDTEAANAQKEKTIADLQKNNVELEKFKFVLEHRIRELRKNIEPKAREIIYLKQQNLDMESELDATISVRSGLQLQVAELQNKLKMTDREYTIEKKMRMSLQILLERIRGHMTRCISVLHDHKALKTTVMGMYQKYGEGTEAGKATSAEQEAICELVRQKNHLEISLTSIKRKLSKDAQFTRTEQIKIMHENMLLVCEINSLRTELKRSRDKVGAFENALGFNQASHAAEAAEMRFKLQHAIEDRDEIDIQHDQILEGKDAVIQAQSEEIDSLSTKVLKIQEYVHDSGRDPTVGGNTAAADQHIRAVLSTATGTGKLD